MRIIGARVFVSGIAQTALSQFAVRNISYFISNGNLSSTNLSASSTVGITKINDVFIDDDENIYIAGSKETTANGLDGYLVCLNDDLTLNWQLDFDEAGFDDEFNGVEVDTSGNVYVCGYSKSAQDNQDAIIRKFTSTGALLWEYSYDGPSAGDDSFQQLVLNEDNDAICTGYTYEYGSQDMYTAKISTGGILQWGTAYNSEKHNLTEIGNNLIIDTDGGIVVSGQIEISEDKYQYSTLRYAEHVVYTNEEASFQSSGKGFIKNAGQLRYTDGTIASDFRYYSNESFPFLGFQDTLVSAVYRFNSGVPSGNDSILRFDLNFRNPENGIRALAGEHSGHYHNFYLSGDGTFEKVRDHNYILYPQVWRDIDLIFPNSTNGSMHFFVGSAGQPTNIAFTTNADSVVIDSTGYALIYHEGLAHVIPPLLAYEKTLTGYQETNWQPQWVVTGGNDFVLSGLGTYSTTYGPLSLVGANEPCPDDEIPEEPTLQHGTYFGGGGDDWTLDVVTDEFNNYYLGGFTHNYDELPVGMQEGIILTGPPNSNGHLYITKFTNLNQPSYTAVLAANSNEGTSEIYFHSMDIAEVNPASGELAFISVCGSTEGNLETIGSPQISNSAAASEEEAFVFDMDINTGQIIWLTVFDGEGDDWARDVKITENGELYVIGSNENHNGTFPTVDDGSSYFEGTSSGITAFIARFDEDRNLTWSTLYDGNGEDQAYCLDLNSDNEIVLAGTTTSTNLFQASVPNSYQDNTLTGPRNYFILELTGNRQYAWSTLFNGETPFPDYDFKTIAWIENVKIAFGGVASNSTDVDLEDPGFGYNFNTTVNSGLYKYLAIFDEQRELEWCTFLDEGSSNARFDVLKYHSNKLFCGHSTRAQNNLLNEIPGSFFRDLLPESDGLSGHDANFSIFNSSSFEVIYSSLINGLDLSSRKEIRGIDFFSDTEYIIAGETTAEYKCNKKNGLFLEGIPVKNNGGFFRSNIPQLAPPSWGPNQAGWFFRLNFGLNTGLGLSQLHKEESFQFMVYPNPTNGHLNIKANFKYDLIQIHDSQGKLVATIGNHTGQGIDISHLPPGVYIIRLVSGDFTHAASTSFIRQ